MELLVSLRGSFLAFSYQHIVRPIFFSIDPETIHDFMTLNGRILATNPITRLLTKVMFYYSNKSLKQTVLGLKFKNPIGLAAGFDKNAYLSNIMGDVGFGFEEVGSITGYPCKGNIGQRLWRLKKSKGLLVYYGLMNDGAEVIARRLKNKSFPLIVGTSIAMTNNKENINLESGVEDFAKAFKEFVTIGDYFAINISCPNTYGGQPFTDPKRLEKLLARLSKIKTNKPIFIKFSPDLSLKEIDQLLLVCKKYKVDGFIISNLTKVRKNKYLKDLNIPNVGGMSGKVVEELSNQMIAYVYKKTQGKYPIIGLGGVFSAEDAYKKIKLGASLVQLITGMIYQGPQVVGQINQGLARLLRRDGFTNISQAIGIDHKK